MDRLYGDLSAEVLSNGPDPTKNNFRIFVYHGRHGIHNPNLVLENLSAAKALRDWLSKVIKTNKSYFKDIGGI